MVSRVKDTAVDIPAEIKNLHRRVEIWRRTRRQREPMPGPLWESAARLAQRHGVARVARIVRLDYHALKQRLGSLDSQQNIEPAKSPTFIEMQLPFSVPAPEWLVEFEHPRGDRMRIQIKGAQMSDLAVLVSGFRGPES